MCKLQLFEMHEGGKTILLYRQQRKKGLLKQLHGWIFEVKCVSTTDEGTF